MLVHWIGNVTFIVQYWLVLVGTGWYWLVNGTYLSVIVASITTILEE